MTLISLLILGLVLSLDNARLAVALGAFQLGWRRALRIAVVFGLWDGFSPLVGLLIGRHFGEEIGDVADFVGPIVLLVFGLYLVVRSLQTEAPEDLDERWVLFGIPLSLSLDDCWRAPAWECSASPRLHGGGLRHHDGPYDPRQPATRGSRRPLHAHPSRSPQRRGTLHHGGRAGTGILRAGQKRKTTTLTDGHH